jgi:hypothetical protein
MINLISVATCAVNMADLTEKKTVFDSAFICATTNQKCTQVIEGVRDKSALVRRFPYAYHLSVKRDYLDNGKVNLDAATKLISGASSIDDIMAAVNAIWTFTPLNIHTGSLAAGPTPFNVLVDNIVDTYRLRTNVDRGVDMHLKLINEMESWDEITALRPPEPMRIRLTGRYSDALEDITHPISSSRVSDKWISYAVQVRRLVNDGECTYDAAQRVLRDIQRDVKLCGFESWEELSDSAAGESRCSLADSRIFVMSDSAAFSRLVKALALIPKESTYAGPKKRRWTGLVQHLTIVIGLAGGAALIWGAYRLVKSMLSKTLAVAEEGPHYDSNGKRQPFKPKTAATKLVTKVLATNEGESEYNDVCALIQRSMRRIEFLVDGANPLGLTALVLDSRTLLVPHHFLVKYFSLKGDKTCRIEVRQRNGVQIRWDPIRIEPINCEQINEEGYYSGTRDADVVRIVQGSVCHGKDIKGKFMTRRMHENFGESELSCWWMKPGFSDEPDCAVVSLLNGITYDGNRGVAAVTSVTSKTGDCGRPYVVRNKSVNRPIIGIHVWGINHKENETGVADISYEAICEAIEKIDRRIDIPTAVEEVDFEEAGVTTVYEECRWWTEPVEFHGRGEINGVKLERFQPTNTAFVRSDICHKNWIDTFMPSAKEVVQVGGERIHPLYTHAQKFVPTAEYAVPIYVHNECVLYMKDLIGQDELSKPLTEFEMINGVGDMKPIILNTSTGYLQRYYTKGKTELFDPLPQEVLSNGELAPQYYEFSDVARTRFIPMLQTNFVAHLQAQDRRVCQGKAPVTFWTATNKDELLDVNKVRVGKTRVFVQPGLELTLLIRKYFGSFLNSYKSNAGFRLCHGIGRDKDEVWGQYLKKLTEVGVNGGDIDYKNYDGNVTQGAIDAFLAVVDHYYCYQDCEARHALLHSVTHSIMIVGCYLTETTQGNKSGNPCTDVLNSVTNWYNMLVSYVLCKKCCSIPGGIADFRENVRCLTYGDDVIYTAKDSVLDWYGRNQISDVLSCFGQQCTSADKSSVMKPCDSIYDLTFLKSPFVPRNGYVAAPLPIKVIHRELIWEKKENVGNISIMDQKIDMALRMMAHHGEDEFNKFVAELAELGVQTHFSFQQWENEMREKQELAVVQGVSKLRTVDTRPVFLYEKEFGSVVFPSPDW